eukprot:4662448-Lingulodinium_polyedra.AAC.1
MVAALRAETERSRADHERLEAKIRELEELRLPEMVAVPRAEDERSWADHEKLEVKNRELEKPRLASFGIAFSN